MTVGIDYNRTIPILDLYPNRIDGVSSYTATDIHELGDMIRQEIKNAKDDRMILHTIQVAYRTPQEVGALGLWLETYPPVVMNYEDKET